MKKKFLPITATLIIWFLLFYIYLPPINIMSKDFWRFMILAAGVGAVINAWQIIRSLAQRHRETRGFEALKPFRAAIIVAASFTAVYVLGSLLSSPILRASAYSKLISVTQSDFKTDIKEVDYNQIPILDKASAAKLAEREMGNMSDMVSQYEVSSYYSQINYNQRPTRVTPLEYGDTIKWIVNRNTGIPGYIKIDMTTQDVDLIRLEDGIKYSPSEYFNRDIYRYIRFRYPISMFRNLSFEIDDNGTPFWICSIETHKIGLFGGIDIKGIVVVNAINGEHGYYDVQSIPSWIDTVYDAPLLIAQYDYYGTLRNGFINSIFGQKDCLSTTEGYNYIALNDDVWVYSGVTSVGGDESIIGFVLINQRTKEANYYKVSGAKEYSAMSSAEGQVQNLKYEATFPILLNVSGEATYFLSLKDGAGLVKKYAMVNVEKYQFVAIGDTVKDCEKSYKTLMEKNGELSYDESEILSISGIVLRIKDIVSDGNTLYYIIIDKSALMFEIKAAENLDVLRLSEGDFVTVKYTAPGNSGIGYVVSIER